MSSVLTRFKPILIGLALIACLPLQSQVDSLEVDEVIEEVLDDVSVVTNDRWTRRASSEMIDTMDIDVREWNPDAFSKYNSDKELSYKIEQQKEENFLQRLRRRFLNWLRGANLGEGGSWFFTLLRIVAILILVGTVTYLLLRMTGLNKFIFKPKLEEAEEIPFSEIEKNIHKVNFDELIAKALKAGNYRGSVRLLYLKSLRILSDEGHIEWQLHKTNRDYLYEIADEADKSKFTKLSSLFEYVWYGEFGVEAKTYDKIDDLYQDFFNGINQGDEKK